MRKLVALLVALPLLYQSTASASRRSQVEDMKKLTVLVTNEGFLGGGRGSGILIDSEHVLTCAHMVSSPNDEVFVYTYPLGTVVKAKVESVNFSADLLLLKLNSPVKVDKKPTFQEDYYDGEEITVVGNTLGAMKWYVTTGVIAGKERTYLMTTAQVHPGNSGGPWFNDKGQILAISDWGLSKYRDIAGGVSAKTINETLKGWEDQKNLLSILGALMGGAK